jgi:Right handed beta helix region
MRIERTVALLIALAPLAAQAGDGRLEINAACVAAGCFAGDTSGFPVQITTAGSYLLTSNLTVPDADTTAIVLGAGASLDLGGFTIAGPTSCTGTPASCTGTGSGSGVSAGAQTSVRNGRITGMGNTGIVGSDDMQIADVTITSNGGNGISGQGGFVIQRCVIDRNGYDGISLNAGQVGATVISNNAVHRNAQVGIRAGLAVVKDNGVKQNGSFGFLGSSAALSGNDFYNNNSFGDQISGGVEIGENLCDGSTTCP